MIWDSILDSGSRFRFCCIGGLVACFGGLAGNWCKSVTWASGVGWGRVC